MILIVDNRDSFTFNLAQAFGALGAAVHVVRSESLSAGEVLALHPAGLVLGPGPGAPAQATLCHDLLDLAPLALPILGVCLGAQVLCEHAGGVVVRDSTPMHGRASLVFHTGQGWLAGLPSPFEAGRYHSLRAADSPCPESLVLDGATADGVPMVVRHRTLPRCGVQFHPESILSPEGPRLFANFLRACGEPCDGPLPLLLRPRGPREP